MTKPVYANQKHKTLIDVYINTCKQFVKDISNDVKYNNYLDVIDVIFEYHNNYGNGVKENNFYDWLMILPINISTTTNGFFAAIETKRNAGVVRAYKVLLQEMVNDVVDKIGEFEPENE
ncbi:MAG: hypothetical protein Unbinned6316contig1000_19 [Prokaryotic dsDNA virus sp.]|nr:MAG: hypothetical protein Unbinned6316contig1000_19 [Prokaryotic dsDNA virus sp.]|tara:strand:- start:13799 stop:14155 length:357 start_codon:yes stop_codon:yes gene_type:complete